MHKISQAEIEALCSEVGKNILVSHTDGVYSKSIIQQTSFILLGKTGMILHDIEYIVLDNNGYRVSWNRLDTAIKEYNKL